MIFFFLLLKLFDMFFHSHYNSFKMSNFIKYSSWMLMKTFTKVLRSIINIATIYRFVSSILHYSKMTLVLIRCLINYHQLMVISCISMLLWSRSCKCFFLCLSLCCLFFLFIKFLCFCIYFQLNLIIWRWTLFLVTVWELLHLNILFQVFLLSLILLGFCRITCFFSDINICNIVGSISSLSGMCNFFT